ncbi:hypothetical protein [uncultured Xylophilus sp.]|uniref:hypothetical protein n=1 Tax=uncultured Xylophilus sp. TaxID=296832 RepID=UPI0025CD9EB6|nr:hypothetical protein [uncultured Xylophilus sp.]
MALWMTALKLVPWDDVIKATPKLVRQAKQLFRSSKEPAPPGAEVSADVLRSHDPEAIATLARALHERVQVLEKEQQASAALMESLAEQHEMVVQALGTLRARARLLTIACAVLFVAVVVLIVWASGR